MTDTQDTMEQELIRLATKYSVTRAKFSTLDFDFDYRRGEDGTLRLVSRKAIIRTLGRTVKVPIGEGHEFSTYEEAFEATKKSVSEYYKDIRAKRSPQQVAAELKRQKAYRERRKSRATELDRRQ